MAGEIITVAAETERLVLSQSGPRGRSAAQQLFDEGVIDEPTVEAMDERYASASLNGNTDASGALEKTSPTTVGTFPVTAAAKTVVAGASVSAMLTTLGGVAKAGDTMTGQIGIVSERMIHQGTAPSAPASGNDLVLYGASGELRGLKGSHISGAPYIYPSFYTGNITIAAAADLFTVIGKHRGDATITLPADVGPYVSSSRQLPRGGGNILTIQSSGGRAVVQAPWIFSQGRVRFVSVDFVHAHPFHLFQTLQGGWGDIEDCTVDGTDNTTTTMFLSQLGGKFEWLSITNGISPTIDYRGRDIANNAVALVEDGSHITFGGPLPTTLYSDQTDVIGVAVYAAQFYMANLNLIGPGKAATGSTGVALFRASRGRINNSTTPTTACGIYGWGVGIDCRQMSPTWVGGSTSGGRPIEIHDNAIGIARNEGFNLKYNSAGVTFDGNDSDLGPKHSTTVDPWTM